MKMRTLDSRENKETEVGMQNPYPFYMFTLCEQYRQQFPI